MTTTRRKTFDFSFGALAASAFVLAGMILLQAGERGKAHAAMAVESDGYTVVTANAGRGEDAAPDEVLYVLSSRDEVLLVYGIEDARKKQVLFYDAAPLPLWFRNARR